MNKNIVGVLYTVGSAVLYGICSVLTKYVSAMGLSTAVILMGRGAIGAVLALAGCKVTKTRVIVSRHNILKMMVLGLFGMCATLFFLNIAYTYMAVGTVTTIHYLYPVIVCLMTGVVFKEKLSVAAWLTAGLSFIGIVIMSGTAGDKTSIGIVLAVLSSISWAFYMLYMEHSGVLSENKLVVSIYLNLILFVFGFIYGEMTGTLDFSLFLKAFPMLLLIGIFSSILASVLIQKGIEITGAGLASIFSVFEPLSSIAFGALIMKEHLGVRQMIGCGIVLSAILFFLIVNAVNTEKHEKV